MVQQDSPEPGLRSSELLSLEGNSDESSKSMLRDFAILFLTSKRAHNLSESCVKSILLLIVLVIKIVGSVFKASPDDIQGFLAVFPTSEYALRNCAGIGKTDGKFQQLVCIPKCLKVYPEVKTWSIYSHSKPDDFTCDHIEYPQRPYVSRRNKCNSTLHYLLKQVSSGSANFLRPIKLYPHRSIIVSLKELLSKRNMLQLCNEWPTRASKNPGVMQDVYDGQLWRDCQVVNGRPFLSQPNNLALSLNVDWFRPFKHSPYSLGVLYFVVLNLPRDIRYLPENVIIAGVLPGPNEPSKTMNSFLEPIVHDLQSLWEGVQLSMPPLLPVRIRAMLLCVTCDIPACRKLCGFLGHNAHLACSKCSTPFPGDVQHGFDFSGYETHNWVPRNPIAHKVNAKATHVALTQTARKDLESRYGLRYSVLLELRYMNIIRQHVIDPMHSLFLGVAKHAVSVWKEKNIISAHTFSSIQKSVDSIKVPSDVGRIPGKIDSGFADFTADQWKNWIVIYSLVALKGRLPHEHYLCWTKFVHACTILCSPSLTPSTIAQAHTLIADYCRHFQTSYGNSACTINIHLACHLADCVQDFGPIHTFWCFAFERMNGKLGAVPTNHLCIEVQLMRKFGDNMYINSYSYSNLSDVQEIIKLLKLSGKRGVKCYFFLIDSLKQAGRDQVLPRRSNYSID